MSEHHDDMPPLMKAFAEALLRDHANRTWFQKHGHSFVDVFGDCSSPCSGDVIEILCLMREGLLGGDNWGSVIWDHNLVPKVIAVAGINGEAKAQLEAVSTWEAVCSSIKASCNANEAQQRALEITSKIQEVIRLAVEFELVAMY